MSTKSTIYLDQPKGDHQMEIHIYEDMHLPRGIVGIDFSCTTCNDYYKLIMSKHMAEKLVLALKD